MGEVKYLFGVVKAGKVIKRYFGHSLSIIAAIRKKFPGCEVEAFDVSEYGVKFPKPPNTIADGRYYYRVRCIETGEEWESVTACSKALGVPPKSLYSAIARNSALRGKHYMKLT